MQPFTSRCLSYPKNVCMKGMTNEGGAEVGEGGDGALV